MYKDKITGENNGSASVTFEDKNTARLAVDWFDGMKFKGHIISVQMAQPKSNWEDDCESGNYSYDKEWR